MKITISGGSFSAEQDAIAISIIAHLRKIGIVVVEETYIRPSQFHGKLLADLAAEGFPVMVEVLPAEDQRRR